MNRGIHRVTANSKAGRRMISSGVAFDRWGIKREISEWNAEVDRKKHEKHVKKLEKRGLVIKEGQ